MSEVLDAIDRDLLEALSRDGRATYQELGRTVGLSPTATADRVRRLVRSGVITGFRAVLDAERMGRTVEAAIDVRLEPGADRDAFADALRSLPAVVEAVHVTGHWDYELRVFCTGTAELDDFAHGATWSGKRAPLIRLYWAFFLRAPDPGGMTYWTNQLTGGKKLATVAKQFAQ